MIKLGEHIDTELRKKADRVYHEEAPPNAEFPYVTYKFTNSNTVEAREDFILQIDIWHYTDTRYTLPLETLTQNIKEQLSFTKHISDGIQTSIYLENRIAVPEPEENIFRRQLRFLCKTYLIGGN